MLTLKHYRNDDLQQNPTYVLAFIDFKILLSKSNYHWGGNNFSDRDLSQNY